MRNVEIPSDADAICMHILTSDEGKQYFSRAAKHRDLHDLGRLMLNQGMRPEEVTALHRNDIDLGRGQLRIGEGKSLAARRTLDLTTESRQILAPRVSGNSLSIFPSPRNPGHHVTRLNGAHDHLAMRESSGSWSGAQIRALRFSSYLCHTNGSSWYRPRNSRRNSRSQLYPNRATLRASDGGAQTNAMLRYDEMLKVEKKQAEEDGRPNYSPRTLSAFCPPRRLIVPYFYLSRPNEHEASERL
jgi:hypothetical protein